MALINYATREINAKVVYYGPGLCGKTTNIEQVYARVKDRGKGKLVTLPTQTDRTLFFDFLPMELGTLKNFKVRIHLYTVPGQVFYNSTRKMVLKGADGVVFVVDSQREMASENIQSLNNLDENLSESGLRVGDLPMVMQYNKRDLPDCEGVTELEESLNKQGFPMFEAVAKDGVGVMETLTGIVKLVLMDLKDRPAAHNLDMTALDRGGADKVRIIRGEFTSISPENEEQAVAAVPAPGAVDEEEEEEYAEALEEAELIEAEEHVEVEELLEPEEELTEDTEPAPAAGEQLEPEEYMEEDELLGTDEFSEYAEEAETGLSEPVEGPEDGVSAAEESFDDLWPDAGKVVVGTGEDCLASGAEGPGPYEELQVQTAEPETDGTGGYSSIDFGELTKDIAEAQLDAAGFDGLAAAMMEGPGGSRHAGDTGEFSSDEISVFKDIVAVDRDESGTSAWPAEDGPQDMGLGEEELSEAPQEETAQDEAVLAPERKTPGKSFWMRQSFTLPVKISSSSGQRELSLKFELTVELQGEDACEEIGVQILPPRPEGRAELAEGHPPPSSAEGRVENDASPRNEPYDRLMNM